jgi:hypothetical protein
MMKARVITTTTLAAALLATPLAAASPSVYDRTERSGVTLGGGLAFGEFACEGTNCDGFTEAYGLNAHVGGMISPKFALVADLWGMAHTEDRVTLTQSLATGALRYWPASRVWLQGGVGLARASVSYDAEIVELESRSDLVPGVMGAIGVELLSTSSAALEVQLRAGTGRYDEDVRIRNVALGAGLSWY